MRENEAREIVRLVTQDRSKRGYVFSESDIEDMVSAIVPQTSKEAVCSVLEEQIYKIEDAQAHVRARAERDKARQEWLEARNV